MVDEAAVGEAVSMMARTVDRSPSGNQVTPPPHLPSSTHSHKHTLHKMLNFTSTALDHTHTWWNRSHDIVQLLMWYWY